MNPEQLKVERAALLAWWNPDTAPAPTPTKTDWATDKDCWCAGWEAGYRAAQRAHTEPGRQDLA